MPQQMQMQQPQQPSQQPQQMQPQQQQPTMNVQVPAGMGPGSTFQVQTPSGQVMTLTVPPEASPGTVLQIPVPSAPPPPQPSPTTQPPELGLPPTSPAPMPQPAASNPSSQVAEEHEHATAAVIQTEVARSLATEAAPPLTPIGDLGERRGDALPEDGLHGTGAVAEMVSGIQQTQQFTPELALAPEPRQETHGTGADANEHGQDALLQAPAATIPAKQQLRVVGSSHPENTQFGEEQQQPQSATPQQQPQLQQPPPPATEVGVAGGQQPGMNVGDTQPPPQQQMQMQQMQQPTPTQFTQSLELGLPPTAPAPMPQPATPHQAADADAPVQSLPGR